MEIEERLKNYYEILEVPYDCSFEQIHDGYVRAKNAYSGESVALYSIMTKEECESMLELIETAYSVLSIPNKRKEYDKVRGITQGYNKSSTSAKGPAPLLMEKIKSDFVELETVQRNAEPISPMIQGSSRSSDTSAYGTSFSSSMDHKEFQINRSDVEISRISAGKRFRLEFTKDNNFEQEIENTTEFNGSFLKKIREYKNVSIDRMSDLTKISRTYLGQIEKDECEKLPALAYIRGFVYQYAKVLKLPPDLVATSYLNYLKQLQKRKGGHT